jgi:predicted dehydrogenase
MNKQNRITRRNFIKSAGINAAALAAMSTSAPAQSANDILQVGCIGIGIRGGSLVKYLSRLKDVKIVALCDVYKQHLEKGVKSCNNPDVRKYADYHDLLADKSVDAVVIATPDFWHGPMVIDAANAGKDIYVEKGWALSVEQAKAMYQAVKKNKVVMQLGHQGRQIGASLQAAQLIKQGVIGPVTLVRTGRLENTPTGDNFYRWYQWYSDFERPDPAQVERDVNWQLWLGDKPKVPFSLERFYHWKCYWAYSSGPANDLLSHEFDFVQSVLGYGIPDTCICSGQNNLLHDGRETPDTWSVIYEYEKKNCTLTFQASLNSHELVQPPEFRGKEALLRFDDIGHNINKFEIYAERASRKYAEQIKSGKIRRHQPFMRYDPKKTPPQPDHMQDFINCVRSRSKPKCNEDEAFVETVACNMSVAAYKKKRQVRWDPINQEII